MNAELKRFNTKRSLTSSTYVCGETMFFERTWVIPRTKEESFGSLRLNISLAVKCLKWDKAKPMFHVAIIKHKNGLKKTRLQSFLFFVCWKINTYFSKKKKKKKRALRLADTLPQWHILSFIFQCCFWPPPVVQPRTKNKVMETWETIYEDVSVWMLFL